MDSADLFSRGEGGGGGRIIPRTEPYVKYNERDDGSCVSEARAPPRSLSWCRVDIVGHVSIATARCSMVLPNFPRPPTPPPSQAPSSRLPACSDVALESDAMRSCYHGTLDSLKWARCPYASPRARRPSPSTGPRSLSPEAAAIASPWIAPGAPTRDEGSME